MSEKIQILLTNDDGIQSPGLWAAPKPCLSWATYTWWPPQRAVFRVGAQPAERLRWEDCPPDPARARERLDGLRGGGTPAQGRAARGAGRSSGPSRRWWFQGLTTVKTWETGVTVSGTVGAALKRLRWAIRPWQSPCRYGLILLPVILTRWIDFSAACHFTQVFAA